MPKVCPNCLSLFPRSSYTLKYLYDESSKTWASECSYCKKRFSLNKFKKAKYSLDVISIASEQHPEKLEHNYKIIKKLTEEEIMHFVKDTELHCIKVVLNNQSHCNMPIAHAAYILANKPIKVIARYMSGHWCAVSVGLLSKLKNFREKWQIISDEIENNIYQEENIQDEMLEKI